MAKAFGGLGATVIDTVSDLPAAAAALEGLIYFQKDTNELKICDGSSWVTMLDTDKPPMTMTSGTITVTATTTATNYLLTMPTGCNCFNLVCFTPVAAVNNTLRIYDWAVGNWSGVQSSTQISINCALGNGVHLDPFTLKFYWTV